MRNWPQPQSSGEVNGKVISFAGTWSETKVKDRDKMDGNYAKSEAKAFDQQLVTG